MATEYLTLPVNVRPMPLKVSSEVFTNEWERCWRDEGSDLTKLHRMVRPFLLHWEAMLTRPEYPKDINYVTLCRLVSPDSVERALNLIDSWVRAATQSSSVYEELEMLFVERVRTLNYFPGFAKPLMAEFVIARDYKLALRHKIVAILTQAGAEITYGMDPQDPSLIPTSHPFPDTLLVKNLDLDPWESYLLELVRRGCALKDMEALTHIPTEHIFYEEKAIWRKLER